MGVKTDPLNPGGSVRYPFGRVKLTVAHHSSSVVGEDKKPIYLGACCGAIIDADGQRLYHAGDTALFSDMQLIGKGGLDAALVPIGDRFTMGPEDAVEALDFLKPKVAVPMHYNTWPPIAQDPNAFAASAARRGHAVKVLAPGQSLAL
jgi:L-ascorbate metabolism protein UlaG (beta-lactamase superfamily)